MDKIRTSHNAWITKGLIKYPKGKVLFVQDFSFDNNDFYRRIFERISINKYIVVPAYDKEDIIDMYKHYKETNCFKDRCNFLVEGEFESIYGTYQYKQKDIHTLAKYGIDNYMFDFNALSDFLIEENNKKKTSRNELIESSNHWMELNLFQISKIYTLLMLFKENQIEFEISSLCLLELCGDTPGILCTNKINDYVETVKNKLVGENVISKTKFNKGIRKNYNSIKQMSDFIINCVSIREYCYRLILDYLCSKYNLNSIDSDKLRLRLAKDSELSILQSELKPFSLTVLDSDW